MCLEKSKPPLAYEKRTGRSASFRPSVPSVHRVGFGPLPSLAEARIGGRTGKHTITATCARRRTASRRTGRSARLLFLLFIRPSNDGRRGGWGITTMFSCAIRDQQTSSYARNALPFAVVSKDRFPVWISA
ncbi:hypothetical protein ZHAS_00019904 [Anopheles sinensis]|uniref:Uncharacterized protein n=1 Tax=Anopheles sinensis TaxID=74873 RepID=A0A084WMI1_ANOSI|nr:hypothetical protein ZHAS_00019904 [Anopheles sinensis]